MLSIGEFSRVCGVTSRTLRYYDKINLIKPSHIDIASGYRFYDLGQLRQMLFINRLKSYEFSLEEIADFVSIKEQAWLEKRLAAKQLELEQKAADYQQRMSELAGDLARIREGADIMSFIDQIEVKLVEAQPQHILHSRQQMSIDDFCQIIGRLFDLAAQKHYEIIGAPISIYHDKEFDPVNNDTELALPVAAANQDTRVLAGGLCVTTTCYGPYSKLSETYTRGMEWLQQHGYTLSDSPYEQYLKGPDSVVSPDDFITQIYFPVKKIQA